MSSSDKADLVTEEQRSGLPDGLIYMDDFLNGEEEQELLDIFRTLPFETFEYKGYAAKRRVIAYGWTYDFNSNVLSEASALPDFLREVRARAARFADISPDTLEEALLTEYPPGAPINWHRDLPMFDKVIGISLLSSCTMKFKPFEKGAKAVSVILQPRSLYLLTGAARWRFQHSIPPVQELRYSITFRTLRTQERYHATVH